MLVYPLTVALEIWLTLVLIQCPLDIQTLDKAAALPIAAATCVTDLRHYINSNLVYSNLKFLVLCTTLSIHFKGFGR